MLKLLVPPLIGAVIGYCTNYIAVKMLFRPRTEKRLFGHRVPFTPGAIPKGKARLAQAAGSVVAGTLITENDISERLLSDDIESHLMDRIIEALSQTIRETGDEVLTEAGYVNLENKLIDLLTDKVMLEIRNFDYAGFIRTKGKDAVMSKLRNSLFGMFIGEQAVDGLLESVIAEVGYYINSRAESMVRPVVRDKILEIGDYSILQLAEKSDYHEDDLRRVIHDIYLRLATSGVQRALKHIDIAGVIEAKINEMSVEELEQIVLEVMKNELNMIVSLGALIGFVLGCLNLLL